CVCVCVSVCVCVCVWCVSVCVCVCVCFFVCVRDREKREERCLSMSAPFFFITSHKTISALKSLMQRCLERPPSVSGSPVTMRHERLLSSHPAFSSPTPLPVLWRAEKLKPHIT